MAAQGIDCDGDAAWTNKLTCAAIDRENGLLDLREIAERGCCATAVKIELVGRLAGLEPVEHRCRGNSLFEQAYDAIVWHDCLGASSGNEFARALDQSGD